MKVEGMLAGLQEVFSSIIAFVLTLLSYLLVLATFPVSFIFCLKVVQVSLAQSTSQRLAKVSPGIRASRHIPPWQAPSG